MSDFPSQGGIDSANTQAPIVGSEPAPVTRPDAPGGDAYKAMPTGDISGNNKIIK